MCVCVCVRLLCSCGVVAVVVAVDVVVVVFVLVCRCASCRTMGRLGRRRRRRGGRRRRYCVVVDVCVAVFLFCARDNLQLWGQPSSIGQPLQQGDPLQGQPLQQEFQQEVQLQGQPLATKVGWAPLWRVSQGQPLGGSPAGRAPAVGLSAAMRGSQGRGGTLGLTLRSARGQQARALAR